MVRVPGGMAENSILMCTSPYGGVIPVVLPPGARGLHVTVPKNAPASRTVVVNRRGGVKLGAVLGGGADGGVVVMDILPGYAGASAGMRPGERILSINGVSLPAHLTNIDAVRMCDEGGDVVTLELTSWKPTVTVVDTSTVRPGVVEAFEHDVQSI